MNIKLLQKFWRLQQLTHLIAITRLFAGVSNKAVFRGILHPTKNIENQIRVCIKDIDIDRMKFFGTIFRIPNPPPPHQK